MPIRRHPLATARLEPTPDRWVRAAAMVRGAMAFLVAGLVATSMGGCQRSLFAAETSRSPFDSFDRRRNQDAPPYYYDSFGTRRPNIRERLKPRS